MKYRILYVDDEEINLRTFKTAFRKIYDIITVTSAIEGLEVMKKEKIDVVITDQMMPKMTGVEFLEKVNKNYPTIPPKRLIISGYSHNQDIQKAFDEYQLFQFISKPWKIEELKQIITNAIAS